MNVLLALALFIVPLALGCAVIRPRLRARSAPGRAQPRSRAAIRASVSAVGPGALAS